MRDFQKERRMQRAREIHADVDKIIKQIKPLLDGRNPILRSVILSELIAIHIVRYHPNIRKEMLQTIVDTATKLISLYDGRHGKGG